MNINRFVITIAATVLVNSSTVQAKMIMIGYRGDVDCHVYYDDASIHAISSNTVQSAFTSARKKGYKVVMMLVPKRKGSNLPVMTCADTFFINDRLRDANCFGYGKLGETGTQFIRKGSVYEKMLDILVEFDSLSRMAQ